MRPTHAIREVAFDHPDVSALLARYFAELAVRLPSYDAPSIEDLRADAGRGTTIVLFDGTVAIGCGALRLLDPTTAEVKRMFVAPEARGRGHARRLLAALEGKARARGCTRVVLDTAAPLHEAAAMYLREGYTRIPRYNDNPVAASWFEKKLR